MISFMMVLIICTVSTNVNSNDRYRYKSEAVEDFNFYCPYTDLCFQAAPENISIVGIHVPCCKECNCSDECGNNCCPDKPDGFLDSEDPKSIATSQCITPGYPLERTKNDKLYEIINKCPRGYNNTSVMTKCHSFIDDFNVNGPMDGFLPVSASSRPLPYKNKYCAECNGVASNELTSWNMNVSCEIKRSVQFDSFQAIPGTTYCLRFIFMKTEISFQSSLKFIIYVVFVCSEIVSFPAYTCLTINTRVSLTILSMNLVYHIIS